jgi:GTP-binding protein Era
MIDDFKANHTKTAFIAVIGLPNVGKSTLINTLVGKKVTIVSDKPQTTRNRIMAVLTQGQMQFVFVDTPGSHRPRTRLGEFMVKSISEAVAGVDAAVLVTEPNICIRQEELNLLNQCRRKKLPVVLALNKTDKLTDKTKLLKIIDTWQSKYNFAAVVPISALNGDGVKDLISELYAFAVDSPHFFPDDMSSDMTENMITAELIREKVLQFLREEIPHGVAVVVESINERNSRNGLILDIEATIFCERENHKGIIIGSRGQMLSQIGKAAREELEQMFDTKVNLQCRVKAREDWRNRQHYLKSFGYK